MKIVEYPHPALRFPAVPLTAIDASIHKIAATMLELMYEARGLGLAAPQVALPYQLLVINPSGDPEDRSQEAVLINPVVLEQGGGTIEGEEGCLSFPGLFQKIRRSKMVRVQAYNLKGELLEITGTDLMSRLLQHEIDHLHGILFIDKMGPIAKLASRGSLKDFERQFRRAQDRHEIAPSAELDKELKELATHTRDLNS